MFNYRIWKPETIKKEHGVITDTFEELCLAERQTGLKLSSVISTGNIHALLGSIVFEGDSSEIRFHRLDEQPLILSDFDASKLQEFWVKLGDFDFLEFYKTKTGYCVSHKEVVDTCSDSLFSMPVDLQTHENTKPKKITQAEQLGKEDFLANKPCVPAYNKALIELLPQGPIGSKTKDGLTSEDLYKAYHNGWIEENLKEPV